MILAIIILSIILLICLGVILVQKDRLELLHKLIKTQHDDLEACDEQLQRLKQTANKLQDQEETINYLQEQLALALQNNQNAEEALSSRYSALTESVAAAELRLEQVTQQVSERTTELNNVAAQFTDLHNAVLEADAKNVAAAQELSGYKLELQQLIKELDDAKETQRAVLLKDYQNEQNWFDFDMSNKEIKLVATIAEIGNLYPELTKDLATIEWKKIWLPKIQDIVNREGLACRGIYRLILKEDPNICYIGQAVNIKERWYEHIKKMIGADTKGNEKLYNYRPEDFYWSVLETGTNDLNSSEHYWIQYYCCKEIGLNKKA